MSEEPYILLKNNEEEYRLVKGSTKARIQPMIDIGFYPPVMVEDLTLSWEEAINRSLTFEIEDELIGELICWDNFLNSFKAMENIYKGIFEPIEVKELYNQQQNYML